MNQELIIALAFRAGFVEYELDDGTTDAFDKRYEKFAALVAAAEREKIASLDWIATMRYRGVDGWGDAEYLAERIREIIRARGETK
jgi:hypothetical protein